MPAQFSHEEFAEHALALMSALDASHQEALWTGVNLANGRLFDRELPPLIAKTVA